MKKIEHTITKRKDYFFVIFIIAVFSGLGVMGLIIINLISPEILYLMSFIGLFILIFVITRKENNDMFQPMEYEEITHQIKK